MIILSDLTHFKYIPLNFAIFWKTSAENVKKCKQIPPWPADRSRAKCINLLIIFMDAVFVTDAPVTPPTYTRSQSPNYFSHSPDSTSHAL